METVRNINLTKAVQLSADGAELKAFEREIEASTARAKDSINIVHFNLPEGFSLVHDEDVRDLLCDVLSVDGNDILVPPLPPGTTDISLVKDILGRFDELQAVTRQRPVMGLIPHTSRKAMQQIADLYIARGLDVFAFDFQGQAPVYANVRNVQIALNRYHRSERKDLFVHAFNTRARSGNGGIASAMDLPVLGLGVDSFGRNHVPPRGGGTTPEAKQRSRTRIFRASDYGYLNQSAVKQALAAEQEIEWNSTFATNIDVSELYEKKPVRTLDQVTRLHNAEKVSREIDAIRRATRKNALRDYLLSKGAAAEHIAQVLTESKKVLGSRASLGDY